MRRLTCLAIPTAVLVGALAPSVSRADWTEFGPEPLSRGATGRIADVAPHPTDASIVYIAAASGGIWRLEGETWTPLTDFMPTAAMGAVALDPNDPDTVYAGSGEGNGASHSFYGLGLYKSTDAGQTWQVLGEDEFAGRTFARLAVSPLDGNVIFAATRRTGDAKGHPLEDGPTGVFRSSDGGVTWEKLAGGLGNGSAGDLIIDPSDPNVIYAGVSGDLFRSSDGGDSWELLRDGSGRIQIAVSPQNPARIWLFTSAGIAHTSTDAGETWETFDPDISIQGAYDVAVAVDPTDETVAFFGGVPVARTDDGGQSFRNATPPHVDIHRLIYDVDGNLLSGGDGGLHRSANNGTGWESLNEGLGIMQFYPGISFRPDFDYFVIGGLQDNGTAVRPGGGGNVWYEVLGADGGYTALHPDNPDVVFAQGQGTGSLSKSTDGGLDFTRSANGIDENDPNAFHSPLMFAPDDPTTLYYATNRLYRSTDTGDTWEPLSDPIVNSGFIRAMAIAPADPQRIYVSTNDAGVFASRDGGVTFTRVLDELPGWRRSTREIAVAPWDADLVFVGVRRFGTNKVGMSRDGGATWEDLTGDLPNSPVNAVEAATVGEHEIVFAATDQGVWMTCELDGEWRKIGETLPNVPTTDVRYDGTLERILLATMGRGVWVFEDATAAELDPLCRPDQGDTDTAGTGTGGDDPTSTGGGGGTTGGGGDDSGTTSGSAGTTSTSTGTSSDSAGFTGSEDGCGCATSPARASWALLVPVLLRRRKTKQPRGTARR